MVTSASPASNPIVGHLLLHPSGWGNLRSFSKDRKIVSNRIFVIFSFVKVTFDWLSTSDDDNAEAFRRGVTELPCDTDFSTDSE